MRRLFAVLLLLSPLVVGCLGESWGGSDEEDVWSAEVSYFVYAPVRVTPLPPQEPYRDEAWPIEALIETEGSFTATETGWEFEGGVQGKWAVSVHVKLNDALDQVLSVRAFRLKSSGWENEWDRIDTFEARDIPLVESESIPGEKWIFRLTGQAACAFITLLDFREHRYATDVEPRDGPDYQIDGPPSCSEDSYLEVVIQRGY